MANPLAGRLEPGFPLPHLLLLSFSPDGRRLFTSLRVSRHLPSPSSSSSSLGLHFWIQPGAECVRWNCGGEAAAGRRKVSFQQKMLGGWLRG